MYATPIELWDELDATEDRSESFTSVDGGDTLDLQENYLIGGAFNGSDLEITVDGSSIASDTDYSVDLRDGELTWNGNDGVDLEVRYKTAPLPNERAESILEDKTRMVDELTNTTFDGTEEVTLVYDIEYPNPDHVTLFWRPVDSVSEVKYNQASVGKQDDFKTLSEGRDGDYVYDDIGITFTGKTRLREAKQALEVTYSYGYPDVPEGINQLCILLAGEHLFSNNILSEAISGRDDYNPRKDQDFMTRRQEMVNSWKERRVNEQVPVTES